MGVRAFVVSSVFTAVNKVSSVVNDMKASVGQYVAKTQTGLASASKFMKGLIPGLGDIQKQMLSTISTMVLFTAILGGIAFSANSIKEYDKALGSLQSVTGLSDKAFGSFKTEIASVAKETKSSSIEVAKAMELIGSANSALLEDSKAMGAMTKAAIILSQASGDDLANSASSLVGVMNQFNLGANQSTRTMNVLAAGAKVGAATIPQVAESMKNFGSVAAGANLSVEQSVALVEVLSQKSVFGAEAGTKLRGSVLKLQAAGLGYTKGQFNMNEALDEANKKILKLKTAKEKDALVTKLFGAENVATGKILLENTSQFKQFTAGVTGTTEAITQSEIRNATLSARLDQLKNKWITMITTNDQAASGVHFVADAIRFLTDNLDTIIIVLGTVGGAYVAVTAAIWLGQAALWAYDVALGIQNALSGKSLLLFKGTQTARMAHVATSKIMTAWTYLTTTSITAMAASLWGAVAATWAFLWPILLVIAAIAAVVTVVVLIIKYWNDWGAALLWVIGLIALFFAPILAGFAFVILLIQSFRRNWDRITAAFKEGGILAGIKMIGAALLDAVLWPLQQILQLMAKLPGIGKYAEAAALDLDKFRMNMGIETNLDENGDQLESAKKTPIVSTAKESQASVNKFFASQKNSKVDINVHDPNNRTTTTSDSDNVNVKLSSTRGGGGTWQ